MVKKSLKDDDYFDDCPVCRAMKISEMRGRDLTEKELKAAFSRAKEKGAIVGGKWFEEKGK